MTGAGFCGPAIPASSKPRGSSPPAGAGGWGWLLTESDGPGRLLIEDRAALVAAADCGIQLQNAALLLRLVAVEAEAITEPLGAHRGGHGDWG